MAQPAHRGVPALLPRLLRALQAGPRRCRTLASTPPPPPPPPPPLGAALISSSRDPFANLAFEDWVLANKAHTGAETTVMLWRNRPCVVIGRHQNPWLECNLAAMRARGLDLVRRRSGGGTVYHDEGNVNISFFTARSNHDPQRNAQLLCDMLAASFGLQCEIGKRHDLYHGGRKISGSAFHLKADVALHHCTLLLRADVEALRAALKVSRPGMVSRGVDSVRGPVVNLSDVCPHISFEGVADGLLGGAAGGGPATIDPTAFPGVCETAEELQGWAWRFGKCPRFTYTVERRFTWGSLRLELETHQCRVVQADSNAEVLADPASQAAVEQFLAALVGKPYSADGFRAAAAAAGSTHEAGEVADWLSDLAES